MDPDATLAEMLDAIGSHDWDRVAEASRDLLAWMKRGGFPPETVGPRSLGNEWHRMVAILICRVADSKATIARELLKRHG